MITALATALLVVPAGAAFACDPPAQDVGSSEFSWPPSEGTDGRWRPVPRELLEDAEGVELCDTTATVALTDRSDLEYRAEVGDGLTVVEYRTPRGAEQVAVVTTADGRGATLDISGPGTETYRDDDRDGVADVVVYDYEGRSIGVAETAVQKAGRDAAGVPHAAYWTTGRVVEYAFASQDDDAVDLDHVQVVVASDDVQDVCSLLR